MSVAVSVGQNERDAIYEIADNELAIGSTLGSPSAVCIIKASGALQKVFNPELGITVFGAMIIRHYDEETGMYLAPEAGGTFVIRPERQTHRYSLANDVTIEEDIFVLSTVAPGEGKDEVDPPAVYVDVVMTNEGDDPVRIATYAYCELRGDTDHDVLAEYDKSLCALVVTNKKKSNQVRLFGCSDAPSSFETTMDAAKAVSQSLPGRLSGKTDTQNAPLGVLHHSRRIEARQSIRFHYLISFGTGREKAAANYKKCPPAEQAKMRTHEFYEKMLSRAVVLTPNAAVNRGVRWAKANMLRTMIKAPTGWSFVNDPTRSNNSVARDTSWFAFGGDYLIPKFTRPSLMTYVHNQEDNGKVVEYYDIRTGKTADYKLNINDNTPLLILALWHHYNTTGDEAFLRDVYPAASKAARYILSQRNKQGLVWCTADGTSDWGIIGWRNVITGYRLSGATTEVNSECYAAVGTVSQMARALELHDESAEFAEAASALKDAINTHLLNPANGLYYLNIDIDGQPRSDITSDLVFPVMFGVASEDTAAKIISRLSDNDFWTDAGIRTTPRDAPNYDPDGSNAGPYGLLGGVWVGVSFWYAFAAAAYNTEFMDHALSASFHNYASDPRRNNTVPGQFSEWLHGETLVNQGMMLSPWFPPRYLWAAVEGVAGFEPTTNRVTVRPKLSPDWKWLGVQNLPYRGKSLSWLAVRTPDVRLYANFHLEDSAAARTYEEDISDYVHALGAETSTMGFRQDTNFLLFVGSCAERTVTTSVSIDQNPIDGNQRHGGVDLDGSYRVRAYHSLLGKWIDHGLIPAERLRQGHVLEIERKGFSLLELTQEV